MKQSTADGSPKAKRTLAPPFQPQLWSQILPPQTRRQRPVDSTGPPLPPPPLLTPGMEVHPLLLRPRVVANKKLLYPRLWSAEDRQNVTTRSESQSLKGSLSISVRAPVERVPEVIVPTTRSLM